MLSLSSTSGQAPFPASWQSRRTARRNGDLRPPAPAVEACSTPAEAAGRDQDNNSRRPQRAFQAWTPCSFMVAGPPGLGPGWRFPFHLLPFVFVPHSAVPFPPSSSRAHSFTIPRSSSLPPQAMETLAGGRRGERRARDDGCGQLDGRKDGKDGVAWQGALGRPFKPAWTKVASGVY